jgi:hypothetical protein
MKLIGIGITLFLICLSAGISMVGYLSGSIITEVYVLIVMSGVTMCVISTLPDCYFLAHSRCMSKEEIEEFGKREIPVSPVSVRTDRK